MYATTATLPAAGSRCPPLPSRSLSSSPTVTKYLSYSGSGAWHVQAGEAQNVVSDSSSLYLTRDFYAPRQHVRGFKTPRLRVDYYTGFKFYGKKAIVASNNRNLNLRRCSEYLTEDKQFHGRQVNHCGLVSKSNYPTAE